MLMSRKTTFSDFELVKNDDKMQVCKPLVIFELVTNDDKMQVYSCQERQPLATLLIL